MPNNLGAVYVVDEHEKTIVAPNRAVQFNVGEEADQKTVGSQNENTITANLQSWR